MVLLDPCPVIEREVKFDRLFDEVLLTPFHNAAYPCHANSSIASHSSRLLIGSPNNPRELLHLYVLPDNRILRLILLIHWNLHNSPINLPSTDSTHKLIKRLALYP